MADFQRVVEFLRDLRQGGGVAMNAGQAASAEELAQMAGDYAALCVQANDRLRRCSAFLQQGLRTEAIHLADESPNLLDLVSALDLPEQQQWVEFCQANNLPVPPALQLDRAAQLNEAYAQDQPLEHIMAQHRLLALARAPIGQRLDALRKIAQLDSANGNWEKDLRQFEHARLRELPHVYHRAVKNHDDQAIADLMQEVNHQTWLEAVPTELSSAVADAFARVQRSGVEVELRKLVPSLRDAFAARSLQECQALTQRWKNIMAAAGVNTIAADLADEIKPVLQFVGEQTKRDEYVRRFKDACKTFGRLLDQDAPDAQLEAGYARLKEFHEEIPEDLTRRYSAKRAGRRDTADRSHKMRLVGIGAGSLVVLAIGVLVVILYTKSAAARQYADKIHAALVDHSKDGLDRAQGYVTELQRDKPSILKEPVLVSAVSDLQTEQAQFTHDQESLQQWLKQAQTSRDAATRLSPAASLEEMAAAANGLQSALDGVQAGKNLDWVDADKQIPPALATLQSTMNSLRGRLGSAVRKELSGLSSALDSLASQSSNAGTISDARARLATLAERLTALHNIPGLDLETQSAVNSLNAKTTQRRQEMDSSLNVADELETIRRQTTSPDELKAALVAFTQRLPRDPRTADFNQAIARIPAASAIDAWHTVIASWNGSFAPGNAAEAQKRIDAVTAYQSANPGSPLAAPAAQYLDFLHRANDALADKGTWQTAFADLIATPLLSELTYMQISDGRRYYVLGDPNRIDRKLNNQFYVSFETVDPKELTKRIVIHIDPPLTVGEDPIPAPHTKVVTGIADALKRIDERNWETFGIDLADQLAKNDDMELVVKVILLDQALKTEETVAGPALNGAYSKIIANIDRQSPAELPWIDPAKVPDNTRLALKQCVESLPSSASVKRLLAEARNHLFASLNFNLAGVGVLLKDERGWNASSRLIPPSQGLLWALGIPPGGTAMQLMLIGKVDGGKYTVDESAITDGKMPQGSIVFITKP